MTHPDARASENLDERLIAAAYRAATALREVNPMVNVELAVRRTSLGMAVQRTFITIEVEL